jgi:hypothetical protein
LEKIQNFQFLIQAVVEANLNGIELVIVGYNYKKFYTLSELGASLRITDS